MEQYLSSYRKLLYSLGYNRKWTEKYWLNLLLSLLISERSKLSMTCYNKWISVASCIRSKLNEVLWTNNTVAPFIGLGTILINNKYPKCRHFNQRLVHFKAKWGLKGLIIPIISYRSPWRTYTKVFENVIQTYFNALCAIKLLRHNYIA